MAKAIARLTAHSVLTGAFGPGLHSDGHNLYLRISKQGGRSWAFVYRFGGHQREAGLGAAGPHGVSLAKARAMAKEGRALLDRRPAIDPLTVWRGKPASGAPTFGQAAEDYITLHEPSWKSARHAAQWRNTLATYCQPLMEVPVDMIDTQLVRKVLSPIWSRIPETASRVRGRIEQVIDFGRDDDDAKPNPARWRGGLQKRLPKVTDLGKRDRRTGERVSRGHHAALSYRDVAAVAAKLRAAPGIVPRCLEFLLLSACRTGEVLGARWDEIDLEARTWSVPPSRLKTGKLTRQAHVVPLSSRMMAILAEMRELASSGYIFPGRLSDRPLGDSALLRFMQGPLGYSDFSVHGLRSAFRDFAGDVANVAWEVAESSLGHAVGNKAARAYRRGDALEKRRELMESWATYCERPPGGDATDNILPFARAS